MLNILYDGRIFEYALYDVKSRTGIFWVAKNILNTMLNRKDVNVCFYLPTSLSYNKDAILNLLNLNELKVKFDNDDFSEINVFFSPLESKPDAIKNYPQISCCTILYDIIPELFPENYPDTVVWFNNLLKTLNQDDYYFSISEYTKQDFLKFFPVIDKNKIETIQLSTNMEYKPCKDTKRIKEIYVKYNIPEGKKYLFSLCSLEPRKNLIRAVKTFVNFIEKNNIDDLVYILGGQAWPGFIERLSKEIPYLDKYKDKIIRAGYIEDEDLAVLYSNAEWFIYTSQYEGFGMPPLEAMACGCPVITSNNSSLPEVVGDAGIMIDWDSDEQHIKAYEKYYYDNDYKKEMGLKGLERSKLFSWDNAVNAILSRMNKVEQKKSQEPLVTVITATYNLIDCGRKDWFIQNLESVKKQTYHNIEHIVIDGASSDGTIELLDEYQQKGWIKYYTEPDEGIYDALNKGILKANGKYVVCLNSDDFYCNEHAVKWLVSKAEENDADACYGDAQRVEPNSLELMSLWKGNDNFLPLFGAAPCHQTFLIKTDVMRALGLYNTHYKVSADNIFILKMCKYGKRFTFINKDVIFFRDGGYSNSHLKRSEIERIEGFYQEYGQYNCLTRLDASNLFGFKYLSLPPEEAIILGTKLALCGNGRWVKEYYNRLFNYHTDTLRLLERECSKEEILIMCKKVFKYFLPLIFSMRNEQCSGVKHKVITILGLKIKFKIKQK